MRSTADRSAVKRSGVSTRLRFIGTPNSFCSSTPLISEAGYKFYTFYKIIDIVNLKFAICIAHKYRSPLKVTHKIEFIKRTHKSFNYISQQQFTVCAVQTMFGELNHFCKIRRKRLIIYLLVTLLHCLKIQTDS